jgi:hypothetical protein
MSAPPGWLVALPLFLWLGADHSISLSPKPEDVTLRGKVMMLAAALESRGLAVKPDLEPIAKQVALVDAGGTITPLFSDEAGRALFLDERLRNRPVEIHGRRFSGVPYLQVITLKIEQDGRLQTPEYFCDVCAISVRYLQICPCCQGPMELRMRAGDR